MPKTHKNTCPAFFLDATTNSSGSYSPCTALGGSAFKFPEQTFKITWTDPVLAKVREQTLAGKKLKMCNRCWSEEDIGFTSERQYLLQDVPAGLDYADPNYYLSGPRHLNIKVSNICNLRCRTCQSLDSYLYHIEGEYYEKTNNIKNTPYTMEKFKKNFTDTQLDELYDFSGNLERIELYGGEPFLDDQIPKFLLRLVSNGRSSNIDLSVSTNMTHVLTDTWKTILSSFKNVIVNMSIDGIGDKFTYMRHPGKWDVAEKNIKELIAFTKINNNVDVVPVITVSALNVWYINEIFEYFAPHDIIPFIILVQWPQYYCVNVFPKSIKPLVEERLRQFNNPQTESIIQLMNTKPSNYKKFSFNSPWQEFKFWTKEKDAYRKESFIDMFSELSQILIDHNEW